LIKAREPASLFAKIPQSEPFGSSHQHKRKKVTKKRRTAAAQATEEYFKHPLRPIGKVILSIALTPH